MDRNRIPVLLGVQVPVALRKESVDRNQRGGQHAIAQHLSLSARRAWIEILHRSWQICRRSSLSARRAWIEIPAIAHVLAACAVALRKESVDRNQALVCPGAAGLGRSPQGERG